MLFVKNLEVFDPYFNLASEEYILESVDGPGGVCMLWRNGPCVVLGANQNAYAEIDLAYAEGHNIKVARRLSGGGCVYHDLGNVNFSFFERVGESGEGKILNFEYFVRPVVSALNELGIGAELEGRNDLLVGGAKFSGNAQRVYKNSAGVRKIMHHGTLLFDSDMGRLARVLSADADKVKSKGVKSVRARVTNLRPHLKEDMAPEQFISWLEDYIIREKGCAVYEFSADDIKNIELTARKYASPEFIFGSKLEYEFNNKKRFGFGTVEVKFNVRGGRISGARVYGDFFGELEVGGLEARLNGLAHEAGAVRAGLGDIGRYIKGCGPDDFAGMFV